MPFGYRPIIGRHANVMEQRIEGVSGDRRLPFSSIRSKLIIRSAIDLERFDALCLWRSVIAADIPRMELTAYAVNHWCRL
jgi:hypothetical protein